MVEERIVKFIAKHHVLSLATCDDMGNPYIATCFYAYDKERNIFIFTSDDNTRHAQQMTNRQNVALGIQLETRIVGRIQGLQVCGIAERGDEKAKMRYIKRFPYAVVAPLSLWMVRPTMMKLTDNTLGFGKKLIWQSEE